MKTLKPNIKTLDTRIGSPAITREKGRTLQKTNKRIMQRDHWLCQICRKRIAVEVDHIIPLHLGGPDADNNKQAICRECHRAKTEAENRARGEYGV